MKKVLSLVLALVLVLGMIPTFAAGETGAENLKAYGFIEGDENGDLMVEKDLTRDEMTKLIAEMNGLEAEASVFAAPPNYTDSEDFQEWAVSYISFAQENVWFKGYEDGSFRAKGTVTDKELLVVLMRVLGYAETWDTVIADAAAVGLTATPGAQTRADAFETMWTAVNTIVNGDTVTLGEKLGMIEPPAPVVVDPKVDSVTFDNLKAFTVMFNQEVDEDTIDSTSVKLTKGTTAQAATYTLLEDGKTLVVVLTNSLTQSDAVKLVVDGVETVAGEEVPKFEASYTVNDVKVPEVLNAVALNPKQLEVYFSEPVKLNSNTLPALFNDIKVDELSIVAIATPDNVKNTVVFTFSTALTEGAHSIEVKGVKDFADFVAPTATLAFTVVKDDTAPIVTGVEVKSKNELVVTFNEHIATPGSFRVAGDDTLTVTWNAAKTKATITNFELNIGAIVEVKVEYKGQKDIMGNEVKEWTSFITQVADDTTLPTVELTSVGVNNKLTLTFSKTMWADGNVALIDKDGDEVEDFDIGSGAGEIDFKDKSDDKVLEITFEALKDVDPSDYSIKITGMKDATVRGNSLATTTIPFKAIDTLEPEVASYYKVTNHATDSNKDSITIFFSEAMDKASAENLANYVIGSTPLSADTDAVSATLSSDLRSVVIVYKGAADKADGTEFNTISVYAVKDIAGNAVELTANTATYNAAATVLFVQGLPVAKTTTTIEVTFNTPIKSVHPSTFVLVKVGTDEVVTNFVAASVKAGTDMKVVTFTTAIAIDADAEQYDVQYNVVNVVTNVYDNGLTGVTNGDLVGTVVDQIAPTLKSVAAVKDANSVVVANKVKLTFTEAVDLANITNEMVVKTTTNAIVSVTGTATYLNEGTVDENKEVVIITFDNLASFFTTGTNKTVNISFPNLISEDIEDLATPANSVKPIGENTVQITIQ